MKKKEFKVLSPTAILGYGYPLESLNDGFAEKPDLVAVDAGSVDPGPYYLGVGKSFTDRSGVKRDLKYIMQKAIPNNIPVVIGSAGGCGAKPHVEWNRKIIEEIAKEEGLSFKLGIIYADIPKTKVINAIKNGQTEALCDLPDLTVDDVRSSKRIVAQMGLGPIMKALKAGCLVVLAGRAYDPTAFAALPIMRGFDAGLAIHMGKILECAAIAADPGSGSDCAMGILKEKSFILKALNKKRKFTATSTAAHTLYEKSDPYKLPGPGGIINLKKVKFKELEGGMVEVSGSRFVPSEKNMVKLEGARLLGYRTVSFAGARDPVMIAEIDKVLKAVRLQVEDIFKAENIGGNIVFHIYGKNGVMRGLEPVDKGFTPKELAIIIEALADSQERADSMCSITRSVLLHYGYKGRISTAGNLAFPFSPSDFPAGEVYEFSIYHLMEVENEDKLFPVKIVKV